MKSELKRLAAQCVTHHCCDCKQYEIERLKDRVRELDEADSHGLGALMTKLELAERVIELKEERSRLREALKKIEDVNSAGTKRPSYADWELRLIARDALGEKE